MIGARQCVSMLHSSMRSSALVRGLSAIRPSISAVAVRMVTSASDTSSSAYADQDIVSRLGDKDLFRVQGYIGGQWRDASDCATLDVR